MNTDYRIQNDFWEHRKTRKLMRLAGDHGVLCLLRLFRYASNRRPDGILSGLTDEEIADEAGWTGNGSFVAVLAECRWLDQHGNVYEIHDWLEHNPWVANAPARAAKARKAAMARWGTEPEASTEDATECSEHATSIGEQCPISSPTPIPSPKDPPISPRALGDGNAASPQVCEDSVSAAVPSSKPHAPKHKPDRAREVWAVYPGNRDAEDFAKAWDKRKPSDAECDKILECCKPYTGMKLTPEEKVAAGALGPFIRQGKCNWDVPFPGLIVLGRKRRDSEEASARMNGYANGNGHHPPAVAVPPTPPEKSAEILRATYGREIAP